MCVRVYVVGRNFEFFNEVLVSSRPNPSHGQTIWKATNDFLSVHGAINSLPG